MYSLSFIQIQREWLSSPPLGRLLEAALDLLHGAPAIAKHVLEPRTHCITGCRSRQSLFFRLQIHKVRRIPSWPQRWNRAAVLGGKFRHCQGPKCDCRIVLMHIASILQPYCMQFYVQSCPTHFVPVFPLRCSHIGAFLQSESPAQALLQRGASEWPSLTNYQHLSIAITIVYIDIYIYTYIYICTIC